MSQETLRSHLWVVKIPHPLGEFSHYVQYVNSNIFQYVSAIEINTKQHELLLTFYGIPIIHNAITHNTKFDKLLISMTDSHAKILINYELVNVKVVNFNLALSYEVTDIAKFVYRMKFKKFREIL